MKKKFLNYMRKELQKKYQDKDKIDRLMYGIEGLYLTVTKAIIIFCCAFALGIFKELIILLLTYNFVRLFAFGMHASKSWHCLMFSLTVFILGAYICKVLVIPRSILYILYGISLFIFIIFSPSDT